MHKNLQAFIPKKAIETAPVFLNQPNPEDKSSIFCNSSKAKTEP